jgi:hypothetical protein
MVLERTPERIVEHLERRITAAAAVSKRHRGGAASNGVALPRDSVRS